MSNYVGCYNREIPEFCNKLQVIWHIFSSQRYRNFIDTEQYLGCQHLTAKQREMWCFVPNWL